MHCLAANPDKCERLLQVRTLAASWVLFLVQRGATIVCACSGRARYRKVWRSAAQEVDAVAPSGPVGHEELAHMPYLEACLKVTALVDCLFVVCAGHAITSLRAVSPKNLQEVLSCRAPCAWACCFEVGTCSCRS